MNQVKRKKHETHLELSGRLGREWHTIQCMTEIYCRDHHSLEGRAGQALCVECRQFVHYAGQRLAKCPYGQAKPTCANCPIHCYKPFQRELARDIMSYAGPKMPLHHPLKSLTHLIDKLRRAEHPMTLRQRKSEAKKKPRP